MLNKKSHFCSKRALAGAVSAIALSMSATVFAEGEPIELDIESQYAGSALMELSKVSGVQVVVPKGIGGNIKLTEVKGKYTVEEALSIMLKGTRLEYRFLSDDSIVVKVIESDSDNRESGQTDVDEEVMVVGTRITKRDRLNTVEPTLKYGIEFFQRFEPNNLEDILKRVPGISFDTFSRTGVNTGQSRTDIAFRGLSGAGGQVLVNSRRLLGTNEDNTVNLSSIPADLIKEIRILRSPTAVVDSQGTGLTIDVILKDGATIPGDSTWNWRAAFSSTDGDDGNQDGSDVTLSKAGNLAENVSYFVNFGFNRTSDFVNTGQSFTQPGGMGTSTTTGPLDNDKKSFNGNLLIDFDNGADLQLESYYLDEDETSNLAFRFEGVFGGFPSSSEDPPEANFYHSKVSSLSATYTHPFGDDSLTVTLSLDNSDSTNDSVRRFSSDRRELSLNTSYEMVFDERQSLTMGFRVDRDSNDIVTSFIPEGNSGDANESLLDRDEDGLDLFAQYEIFFNDTWSFSIGARSQSYDYDINGSTLDAVRFTATDPLNPFGPADVQVLSFPDQPLSSKFDGSGTQLNAHLRWDIAQDHELRLSYSNTIDLPDSDDLQPAGLVDLADFGNPRILQYNVGNPNLEEGQVDTLELGWDWHFGEGEYAGVLGVAVFSKKVQDGITFFIAARDDINTIPNPADVDRILTAEQYMIDNLTIFGPTLPARLTTDAQINYSVNRDNDNDIFGAEVDFSVPMAFIGLPDLTLSSNISYTDTDFNLEGEPNSDTLFYNVTIDHLIPSINLVYGISYNERDDERTVEVAGISTVVRETQRDPSLDVFVEKRFSGNLVIRLTGTNVTDAESVSSFVNSINGEPFFTLVDPVSSGPSYSLTVRGSF